MNRGKSEPWVETHYTWAIRTFWIGMLYTLIGFVLAFVLGLVAQRLRLSPLVGYLLAGVIAGPFTPGLIADQIGRRNTRHQRGIGAKAQ